MSKTKYVVLMYEIFRLSKNINFFQKSEVIVPRIYAKMEMAFDRCELPSSQTEFALL